MTLSGGWQHSLTLEATLHGLQGKPGSEEVAGEGWSFLSGRVPLAPLDTPTLATGHYPMFLWWCHQWEGASKGEEDPVLGTCARRVLTSVQTQSGAINGNLPSASSLCPASLLRWAGSTRQRGRDQWMDARVFAIDPSLTRAAPQPPAGVSVNGKHGAQRLRPPRSAVKPRRAEPVFLDSAAPAPLTRAGEASQGGHGAPAVVFLTDKVALAGMVGLEAPPRER